MTASKHRDEKPVVLHRYWLPSVNGEGWAEVVVGSNGFFAAVSDYGNYAFRWTHFGDGDFREFLLQLDHDYVRRKLDPSEVFDAAATQAEMRGRVEADSAAGRIDPFSADEALKGIQSVGNEHEFGEWVEGYPLQIDDAWEMVERKPAPEITGFVTRTLPRIKDAIRAEMTAEVW